MPIEFRCGGCGRLLRVPDQAAGRPARCSQCGHITTVALAGSDAAVLAPTGSLADSATDPPNTSDLWPAANPYQPPASGEVAVKSPFRELTPASRTTRFFGAVLDTIIVAAAGGLVALLGAGLGAAAQPGDEDVIAGLAMLFGGAAAVSVSIINWVMITRRGQSIAKRILGMRIVTLEGDLPGFVRGVLLRAWIPFAINQLCNLFGLIDALWVFGEERRCLHDLIASTVVIDVRSEGSPEAGQSPFLQAAKTMLSV